MEVTIGLIGDLPCEDLFTHMLKLQHQGVKSFEVNVRSLNQELVLCTKSERLNLSSTPTFPVKLEHFFELIAQEPFEIILNVQEPNLEQRIQSEIERWELRKYIRYTGQVNPTYLSPWDRLNVYYNVENCLPNFYQLETVKKTHVDVIHYFTRLYKVSQLRMNIAAVTKELLEWVEEKELKLSVDGVATMKEAQALFEMGVHQVTMHNPSSIVTTNL